MADIQQTIQNIAQQIPGYPGYQSKERRRDADKVLRERLANQYDTLRDQLTAIIQEATRKRDLSSLTDLERADQQLQLFIARLKTAPLGYAGWFDAAQIQEADLDQLYQFDSSLAGGVESLKELIGAVENAVKAKSETFAGVDKLNDALADLNSRLDAREEFVALGKRPSAIPSPLGALQPKAKPSAQATAFEQLKSGDAVSYAGTDYLVT
jgi:DNA repair exonuclease SbcCD ATPase subunit